MPALRHLRHLEEAEDPAPATRMKVMQVIDTLSLGGAERCAVNLANHLPRDRYITYLCSTRAGGSLAASIAPHVCYLHLGRRHRFDASALARLVGVLRRERIRILHAHSTSIFVALAASMFAPFSRVVWHNHYGRLALEDREAPLYRLVARRIACTVVVSDELAHWSQKRLGLPPERIWFIPNFVAAPECACNISLPGQPGLRIVCVANQRPEKDLLSLLQAMALARQHFPEAHLILVGSPLDTRYGQLLIDQVARLHLQPNVSLLGGRADVHAILSQCDIGVLSSISEGFPMALVEYGSAGLAAIATEVGQCAEILDHGNAGLLVPPASPEHLAGALCSLLRSPQRRQDLANRFRNRTRSIYSAHAVVERFCKMYEASAR